MGTLISSTETMNKNFKEAMDMAVKASMPSTLQSAALGIDSELLEMYRLTNESMTAFFDLANEYAVTLERMDNRLKAIEEKLDKMSKKKED